MMKVSLSCVFADTPKAGHLSSQFPNFYLNLKLQILSELAYASSLWLEKKIKFELISYSGIKLFISKLCVCLLFKNIRSEKCVVSNISYYIIILICIGKNWTK